MINFRKIAIQNFMSFGNIPTTIELDSHKSVLVVGENGVGKSVAFTDAITFALFGKPYRKINKSQMVNSINKNHSSVEIWFDVGGHSYRVARGIKPNIFEIFRDDVLIDQDSSVAEYQNMLETDILQMSFKTFTQIVILGTAQYTPFMELTAQNRREFVEDLLDLEVFSLMNVTHKANVAKLRDAKNNKEQDLTILEVKLNAQNERNSAIEKMKANSDKEIDAKISSTITKIEELQESNASINEKMAKHEFDESALDTLNNRLRDLRDLKTQISTKLSSTEKDVKFFGVNDVCPVCRQTINREFKNDVITKGNAASAKYSLGIEKIIKKIAEVEKAILEQKSVRETLSEFQKQIGENERYIAMLDNDVKSLREEKVRANEITAEIIDVTDLKDSIRKLKTELTEMKKAGEIMSVASLLLKDGGIKAKVIEQYIPKINEMINEYLAAFELFVHFSLDENFNEVIKARHYDEYSYYSFSEGEKARINISLLLSWRKLAKMRKSVDSNLLIMDEVFDGSINAAGVENFKNILLNEPTNYIVISHKKETHESNFDAVYGVEKIKNFTVLELREN